MKINYKQCHLCKSNIEGNSLRYLVTIIPEKYAKVGKILKIKTNGVWNDGFQVLSVSDFVFTEDTLPYTPHAIKLHRMRTGDSSS